VPPEGDQEDAGTPVPAASVTQTVQEMATLEGFKRYIVSN